MARALSLVVRNVVGISLYLWCVWDFAAIGRGTPGPWDAPRQVVAAGPYLWLRNPICRTVSRWIPHPPSASF